MNKPLKFLIVISLLLLVAGPTEAINIIGFPNPVGPEALENQVPGSEDYVYSDVALEATLGAPGNLDPRDRGAMLGELAVREDIRNGIIPNHSYAVAFRRGQYVDAFYERNELSFNDTGQIIQNGQPIDTGGPLDAHGNNKKPADNLPECSLTQPGNCILRIFGWVGQLLVWLFSWLVYVANELFDLAIKISVREFKQYTELPGVKNAWRISRDLVNVSLIFVLLYIAIGMILQLSSVSGKKLLTKVIIAALLVNFSFLFTGVIIDASNVVANEFYTLAAAGQGVTSFGAPNISAALTKAGATGYFNPTFGDLKNEDNDWWDQMGALLGSYFGQIVLMLITSFVLFAGAVLFLVRTIVLIFVLVLSPLAFLGFAVGGALKRLSDKWRDALTNQVIFAPVYLLLIYMTVKLVSSGGEQSLGKVVGQEGGLISSLVVFAIVNGLMIGSLLAAKSLGVAGAGAAAKFGGAATGFGARLMGRGIKGTGRGAVYATAAIAGGARRISTAVGGGPGRVASWIANTRFGRGVGAAGQSVGGAVKSTYTATREGIKLADQKIPGARTITDAFRKPGEAINEMVAGVTGVSILGRTKDEERERQKKLKDDKEVQAARDLEQTKAKLKKTAKEVDAEGDTPDLSKQDKREKEWAELKTKDVVKLDKDTLISLARFISKSQMEALKKSDDITEDTLLQIQGKRDGEANDLENILRRNIGVAGVSDQVKKQLGITSGAILSEFVSNLDKRDDNYGEIIETLAKNISPDQINKMIVSGEVKQNRLSEIRRKMLSTAPAATSATVGGGPGGSGRP